MERNDGHSTEVIINDNDERAAFIHWAFGLFGLRPYGDDCEREVHMTAYDGCYGRAGYVLTINGSPPRATIVVEPASGRMLAMRQDRVVRGANDAAASRAARRRYADAQHWLVRLGLAPPAVACDL